MKKYPWRQKFEELFGLDLRAMAFLRITFACFIIFDLIQRASHMGRDYTDYGILPRSVLTNDQGDLIPIHLLTGSLEGQIFLFIVAGIFALGLLVGYQTRLCSIFSWLLVISIVDRNFLIIYGGDAYLWTVLFWGIFLPWGQKYSVDSLLSPVKCKNNTVISLATFGFILQVCLVYFFAGSLKSGPQWKDGTALYYVLSADEWTKPFGQSMLHYPAILGTISNCVPYFEKYVSLLLIFPFFTPCFRLVGVGLIILFHTGISAMMEVSFFSLISIAAAIGILPKVFWDKLPLPHPSSENKDSSANEKPRTELFLKKIIETIKSSLCVIFLTACLIYILFSNFSTLPNSHIKIAREYRTFANLLHLNQQWGMFSPGVDTYSGWYVIEGSLKNGQEINALSGEPVDFNKPTIVYKTYHGERDRKLITRLALISNSHYRVYYAHFLCRDWNSSHTGDLQMKRVQAFFMKQVSLLDDQKSPPEKRPFIDYTCQ